MEKFLIFKPLPNFKMLVSLEFKIALSHAVFDIDGKETNKQKKCS